MRAECAVYIIRDNHQVGVIILHDIDNACHRLRAEGVTGRIAGIGHEERFWLGPEGGPFSLYFKGGQEQVYDNWVVPAVLDTEPFKVEAQNESSIRFVKDTRLTNASGDRKSTRLNSSHRSLSRMPSSA